MSEEFMEKFLEKSETNKQANIAVAVYFSLVLIGLILILIFIDTSIEIKQILIAIIGLFSLTTLDIFRKILNTTTTPLSITVNNNTYNKQDCDNVYNNYQSVQKQDLAEAAAEIQKLLKQLTPNDFNQIESEELTQPEKQIMTAKLVEKIEESPTLKERIINAVKAGGISALETAINSTPMSSVMMAVIEGWLDEENIDNESEI